MVRRRRRAERATKPFEAATKHLLESDPATWMEYVGLRRVGPVDVIDADLSTVLAEADKVLWVNDPLPWVAHIELQASHDRALGSRLLNYNVLLHRRHRVAVKSVVVLLRPEADGPELTGVVRLERADGTPYLELHHQVVRAWQQPVETVLAGGLATLPLAPLADVTETGLPAVIRRMDERFSREATPDEAATLWTATYLLLGLRYPSELTGQLLRGVRAMRESTTYQAILAEGRAEEAKRILVLLGGKRFGPPDARTRALLDSTTDLDRIEQLTEWLLDVGSWSELLVTP